MGMREKGHKLTAKLLNFVICTICMLVMAAFIPNIQTAAANGTTKVTKKNDKFKVTAEYGLGGLVMYDKPLQVSVTVECKENFNGVIRVIPMTDYSQTVTAYGKRISLAAGEAKTYKMTADIASGGVYLAILNDKDKVVYEESTSLDYVGSGQYAVVGILSDDYTGIAYFNGASLNTSSYSGSAYVVELTKDSFPENQQVLDIFDYIIIDNFDTSSMSDKQYEALKQWTSRGGKLILSLGSHYQNVLAGFKDDFVSGNLGNVSKKKIAWNSVDGELTLDGVECVDFTLNDGEEFGFPYGAYNEAAVKSYGIGRVVVLSYSLSMEPLSSYSNRTDVASMLLEATQASSSTQLGMGDNGMFYNLMRLASNTIENKVPSPLLYGMLLLIYVVLVGPVLYLVLKKKNMREKIWVAIPITAAVFTGIIYCTSFMYRINKPMLNTFSLINVSEGGAMESVYSDVICPSAKQYRLQFSDEYSSFRTNSDNYNYSFFNNSDSGKDGRYDYMFMDTGSGNEVIMNSSQPFDSFTFATGRVIYEGVGSITYDLDCTSTGFTGTVTNDTAYDLSDVVISYENHVYVAGDLKKGETAEIDPDEIIESAGYGVFDQYYPYRSSQEVNRLYQINDTMESNVVNTNQYNHGYIWGTVLSYKTDLMDDKYVKNSGSAVIMETFEQGYSDVTGSYYNNIDYMIVDISEGDYDRDTGIMYSNDVVATYSFDGYGNIDELMLIEDNLGDGIYADVYAFNADTGDFEQIFENDKVISGGELNKYLSHGIIKLKYVKSYDDGAGGYYDYYIPKIAASGK